MAAVVAVRYEDDSANPKAATTAMHISVTGADFVDETDNSIRRFYLSAEHGSYDAARSPEFESDRYEWDGWIPPVAGLWTCVLRNAADDSLVAGQTQAQFTADA